MKTKKINKSGGFTIPSDIRREIDMDKGQAVDIEVEAGKLIISKHTPRCMFCRTIDGVVRYQNNHVCSKCIKEMGDKVDG
ncbi:transcriptional regulator/antitoxin, MazE [Alkaliphilus metalliredigens QYMF]|nr:AbrB/MazE/SpoVT family DNA-binding domain-containing protein [Alkaliphilus metalliredigens]ABR48094.1 transcriptional regulator/antitoxin, MazE [Alkaliphilus metalliredigens QYMF]